MSAVAPAPAKPRILRERELWLLVAATSLFFGLPILLGQTYFFRDLYFWSFPQTARLAAMIRSGQSPLWDPLIYGGQPLLGNIQYFAFYPTTALSLILPAVTAVNLEIVLHFVLCAAAAYALARVLGLTPVASALAGAVFVFSGVTLSFGNLFGRLLAMPSTVLLLLFWHRYLEEKRRLWFALAAAAGALVIFAGSAEQLVFSLALAVVWGVVFPYSAASGSRIRRFALAVPLTVAILGLTAVQTFPMAGIVHNSWRGAGLPSSERGLWSVNPRRLPELIVPGFFGDVGTMREADYWGAGAQDMGFPILLSFYVGATVLILAARAAASRAPGPLPRACRVLLGVVLFGSIVLSLGRFLPTGGLFDPTLLLGGVFRFPEKFLFMTPLAAALLAGHAVDASWRPEASPRERRALAVALGLASLALLLAAGAIQRSEHLATAFQRFFFLQGGDEAVRASLALRFFQAGAVCAAATAIASLRAGTLLRRAPALLCGLVALDMAVAGWPLNPTAPRELLTRTPPLATAVRELIGDKRFFRDVIPRDLTLHAPSNQIRWRYEWNREMLTDYSGAGFGIPLIFQRSFDGLDSARHSRVTRALLELPWPQRLPILSAASVQAFLTHDEVAGDGVDRIAEIPNASNKVLHLYRNTRAAGQAELVHFWRPAGSTEEALAGMVIPGFDPRRHAVVQGQVPPPPTAPCAVPTVEQTGRGLTSQGWKTRDACDGLLVVSELNDPGWDVFVDGRKAPVLVANALFSSVYLPAGTHEVLRVYRPASLRVGAVVSLLALVVLVGATLRAG